MDYGRFKPFLLLILILTAMLLVAPATSSAAPVGVEDQDIRAMSAAGAHDPLAPAAGKADGPKLPILLGRLALAMGVVFALMAAVVWAARRYLPQAVRNTRGGAIDILSTRPLGARRSLMLVRVQDKTVLLGVTPQAIQFLTELDQEQGGWPEMAANAKLSAETRRHSGTTSLEDLS
jgi:flagellar biosynthetic protein FliO